MSRLEKWASFEKRCKATKKSINSSSDLVVFLNNKSEDGFVYDLLDNTHKDISKIEKASTLRRLLRKINNFYYLAENEENRKYILERKKALETAIALKEENP